MIIYGWNAKNIKQAPLENYECEQCHEKQSDIAVLAKYVHIFWIPVFPYSKTAVIVCNHCKHQTEESAINLGTKDAIKKLKGAVPIPKYLFSGLALIVLAIAYFTYLEIQNDEREQAYISNPQAGDVYVVKDDEEKSQYNHFLMKVRKVEGDSLWVSYSSFGYNGIVDKLDPKDGFYNIVYTIHKSGIKAFDQSGELKKVMRDYPSSSGFDQEVEFHEADSVGN